MLNKNLLAIFTIIGIILLPSAVFAAVICNPCEIDGCVCQITDCSKGILNAFTISDCSGIPYIRDTFNNGVKTWYPQNAIGYFILILCDDGTRSVCMPQMVLPRGVTATTTTTTTTREITTTTTEFIPTATTTTEETGATYITDKNPSGGGFNFFWVIIILIFIVVAFYFLKMKKKKEVSYEEVYKKWSR